VNIQKVVSVHYDDVYDEVPYAPIATRRSKGSVFTGNWRTMRPVVEEEKCTNCNICWKFCPDVAVKLGEKFVSIDYDYCKGCGICAHECPVKAITMIREMEASR